MRNTFRLSFLLTLLALITFKASGNKGVNVSKFRVGVRYTAELAAVDKYNFSDDAKNRAIALTLGIAF